VTLIFNVLADVTNGLELIRFLYMQTKRCIYIYISLQWRVVELGVHITVNTTEHQ